MFMIYGADWYADKAEYLVIAFWFSHILQPLSSLITLVHIARPIIIHMWSIRKYLQVNWSFRMPYSPSDLTFRNNLIHFYFPNWLKNLFGILTQFKSVIGKYHKPNNFFGKLKLLCHVFFQLNILHQVRHLGSGCFIRKALSGILCKRMFILVIYFTLLNRCNW